MYWPHNVLFARRRQDEVVRTIIIVEMWLFWRLMEEVNIR